MKIILDSIQNRKKVLFKKENVNRIFNELISHEVEYDTSLKGIQKNELVPYFYFDENRKDITLDIKLKYGEDLYNILTEGYKELEKYGEVYYSEKF